MFLCKGWENGPFCLVFLEDAGASLKTTTCQLLEVSLESDLISSVLRVPAIGFCYVAAVCLQNVHLLNNTL